MGTQCFDQFSLLHGAVGVIFYFWGISFWWWMLIHILYEIIENTSQGMMIINHYFTWWPGGKEFADAWVNNMGDLFSGAMGWWIASLLDRYMGKLHPYTPS